MARMVFRGLYAAFPVVGLLVGDLAYATDLLTLYSWNGTAWELMSDFPDYQGETSGLYPIPEWTAYEGNDIALTGSVAVAAALWRTIITYPVPAGLTLSIKSLLAGNSLGARKRLQLLSNAVVLLDHYHAEPLTKEWAVPLTFASGVTALLRVWSGVADGSTQTGNLWGWEI